MPGLHRRLDRSQLSDLTKVRRLGVLRPDGIGDMVLTTGMLRALRRQLPATRITLICQTPWASWMRACPCHGIHPEHQRLAIFLESGEQLAFQLERGRAIRRAFSDSR